MTELPLWVQDRETVLAHDQGVEWREGQRPDYSYTNEFLHKESKFNHPEGSLEAIAQNLVRTFEMEASHKINPQQWLSIVADQFRMSSNGGEQYTAEDVVKEGTYNLFISETEHYSSKNETFESSFELFHNAFPNGFLWELTEVLAGPPNVTFKWRHWGTFTGSYKDYKPTGETIEITGMSIARVTEDLKIESLEHYFDNNAFLEKLTAGGCPFHS
ncbi:SnoaL-like polyketide cyclase [Nodularia spumigena CENA596]|uniref:SnoaL-like polyketide cyclase n=1 Tax=Nodularia spumigena CENA596 TaxID=1819295 RepID=A0A166JHC5_NODSP|nr:ester cyclase [Nodularia spumigena]KZL49717.1 SnoaL-like polyketide cyclase [Nodularia spumigena CENA596]